MSADFDPYQKWLGIPPAEQPPNHYRLLNLPLFEPDTNAIASVIKRLTAYCQARAKGQNGAHALRVLESVAAAEACLLDPQAKAEYDASLGGGAPSAPLSDPAVAQPANGEPDNDYQDFAQVAEVVSRPATAKPTKPAPAARVEPAAEPAANESFFDGMDFSAPRSTGPVKTAGAKGTGGKASVLGTAGIGLKKSKPTANKLTKSGKASSGGVAGIAEKLKLEPAQIYAIAGGGLAVAVALIGLAIYLNMPAEPKATAPVAKVEQRAPQFVPATFDAGKSAQEVAKRKRVPLGKKFIDAPITRVGDFFFTEVTIGGKPAGRFLIDTGAPVTALKKSVADKLGLKESSTARIGLVGGPQTVSYRTVDSLKIKDAHWEELTAAAADLAPWEKEVGAQFDGVLGRDVWYQTMFAIDPGGSKLVIYDRDEAPISDKAVFLTAIDNRPCIEVHIDGGPEQRYLLATGCAHDLMKIPRDADGNQTAPDEPPEKIAALSIFDHEHQDLTQTIAPLNDAYVAKDSRQQGVVGAHVLARYMLVIDVQRNKIMVVPQKK